MAQLLPSPAFDALEWEVTPICMPLTMIGPPLSPWKTQL